MGLMSPYPKLWLAGPTVALCVLQHYTESGRCDSWWSEHPPSQDNQFHWTGLEGHKGKKGSSRQGPGRAGGRFPRPHPLAPSLTRVHHADLLKTCTMPLGLCTDHSLCLEGFSAGGWDLLPHLLHVLDETFSAGFFSNKPSPKLPPTLSCLIPELNTSRLKTNSLIS